MKVFSNFINWCKSFSFNFFNKRSKVVTDIATTVINTTTPTVTEVATVIAARATEHALEKTDILTSEEKKKK